MIRCLFVYRYCTLGGVETGMRYRIEHLRRFGVEAHGLFLRDYGGRRSFDNLSGQVFFGASEAGFVDLVRTHRYHLISVIDSFDVLDWIRRMNFEGRVMVELRSSYEHTLVHLKRLADCAIDGILVPSQFQSDNVARYLPRRVLREVPRYVASNFIDLETFRPQTLEGPAAGRKIVCWIGRIDPLKNWPEFLAIADRLSSRRDVEFWMVGGGGSEAEARQKFRKSLAGVSVAGRLRWWPLLACNQMPSLYNLVAQSGGLVLLTAKCESFGFAVLETLACQCPLIAPAVGAIPEIVQDGVTGLLYRLGDVDAAAQLAAGLLDDEKRRQAMAAEAARAVRQRFSPDSCAAVFARVIKTLVGRAEPAPDATLLSSPGGALHPA